MKYCIKALLQVKFIYMPTRYEGPSGSYAYDIALLQLAVTFQITTVVQPICVDWTNIYETEQLRPNSIGVVSIPRFSEIYIIEMIQ